jgi:hypothetical protein
MTAPFVAPGNERRLSHLESEQDSCERREIARRRTEEKRAEVFFLCERRRRRRIPSAMREQLKLKGPRCLRRSASPRPTG